MFKVGAAKTEITPDCVGVGLLGWGDAAHKVKGVKRPLYARAVVIESVEDSKRFIIVCAELCFITEAVRVEALKVLTEKHSALHIKEEELLLTATHTHNAPGGHSKYLLYNLTVPGFQPKIFQTYVDGVVQSIVRAFANAEPATIKFGADRFSERSEVAFNRSLKAWLRNPEAIPGEEIDREMLMLRFDSVSGKPLACVNWFSVHCTSIHRTYPYIHSDNKGVAATVFEDDVRTETGETDFIAIFAQGAAGDVTPNFVKHFWLKDTRGPFRDDEKSCEFNARLQVELAKKIYKSAAGSLSVAGSITGVFEKHDFSHIDVAHEFAPDHPGARTGPAAIGCNFLAGTAEGHGAPIVLVFLAVVIARLKRYLQYFGIRIRGKKIRPPWKIDPIQGPKIPFMESGRGKIFGVAKVARIFLPSWLDPVVRNLKTIAVFSEHTRRPFTPQVLPLQLVRLGSLVFVAVPAEFTTVSGKRLKQTILKHLQPQGVERVVICGFSNAYSGYVTTFEEYQVQAYEGASTHFGMWTLAAYQTLFAKMCQRLK